MPDLTKITGGCQRRCFAKQWVRPGPESLHQEQAPLIRQIDQFCSVGGVGSQWFLNQDRFSAFEAQFRGRKMIMVAGGDVDNIDIWISGQLCIGVVGARNAMIGCEPHGLFKRARADGDQSCLVRQQGKITDEHRCDVPGGEDAPAGEIRHSPHPTTWHPCRAASSRTGYQRLSCSLMANGEQLEASWAESRCETNDIDVISIYDDPMIVASSQHDGKEPLGELSA